MNEFISIYFSLTKMFCVNKQCRCRRRKLIVGVSLHFIRHAIQPVRDVGLHLCKMPSCSFQRHHISRLQANSIDGRLILPTGINVRFASQRKPKSSAPQWDLTHHAALYCQHIAFRSRQLWYSQPEDATVVSFDYSVLHTTLINGAVAGYRTAHEARVIATRSVGGSHRALTQRKCVFQRVFERLLIII